MEEGGPSRQSGPIRGGAMVTTPVERGQVYWLSRQALRTDQAAPENPSIAVVSDALKDRPIIIVSRDELNRGIGVLAVPFYSQQLEKRKTFKSCVHFSAGESGLPKECVAKCDEISEYDKTEIDFRRGPIGRAKPEKMRQIVDAIRYCIRDESLTS